MFLENYEGFKDKENGITKLHMQSCTYNAFYKFWVDNLFERVMKLFVWENTYTVNEKGKVEGIKPKEIEQRLILAGHCGITKILKENELTAMYGSFVGVTKYIDEFTNYMVHSPIFSGKRTINKDVVVIDNCSLRNPLYPLIHHYATLLAHTEVSLASCLVRLRENGGIPVAKTEMQKQSITNYQTKIFNGQFSHIGDIGMLGVDYAGNQTQSSQSLLDIIDTREKLIKSFFSDIGVRSAFEKRSNSIEAEVEADTSLLLINISDMIKSREEGCERVNKLYGTNWNVHIAKEIDYSVENARIQFDTQSEYHQYDDMEEGEDDVNSK